MEFDIFQAFLLVMVRFGGLIATAPVLSSGNIPPMAKAGLTALAAVIITATLLPLEQPIPDSPMLFALMGAGELLIGMLIGFIMTLVFSAIQVAGQIIDLQSGFGFTNIFNPALETQFPIFGFFLFVIAVLYLLLLNGHHLMIRALVSTYDTIPFGGFVAKPEMFLEMGRWGRHMFLEGLMISAPLATVMLLAYASMGILGRLVPQIHLFVIGFPVTIALGLFVCAAMIGVYLTYLDGMFLRMFRDVEAVIRGMG